ncbi:MAG: dethiobiotin synthase [Muribaculaceae bacterium]|nr:dethiobiotin synthase [Muribaculaceae bacterium]
MADIIFITGIGTNVGKSYATGWLANKLNQDNDTITLKMIQTGNVGFSEDIEIHRAIMGLNNLEIDKDLTTAPIIMSYPASPHLAAKLDNVNIDLTAIDKSIEILDKTYNKILIEGAGGLMVPIFNDYTTLDYIKDKHYPVCLVTNGTLGSINHTLLSLFALKNKEIDVKYMIYNSFFDEDEIICSETKLYLDNLLHKLYKDAKFLTMPKLMNS